MFPIVALLTFGTIEFGILFSSESTTTSSTQAGARLGAAGIPLESAPNVAYDKIRDEVVDTLDALSAQGVPNELWIYQAGANGEPVGGFGGSCASECVRYTWNGSTFVRDVSTNWAAPDACLTGGLDEVGVYLSVTHNLISGLLFDSVDLDEHSTALLEPLPTEQCP